MSEMEPIVIEIKDVIDLHTFHPKDIPELLDDYIRACVEKKYSSVRTLLMRKNLITASLILVGLLFWLLSGLIFKESEGEAVPAISEQQLRVNAIGPLKTTVALLDHLSEYRR